MFSSSKLLKPQIYFGIKSTIIKNINLLLILNKIHIKIVQKFPSTSVKWHLSLFLKIFRVSASATSLGKLFHSLATFTKKEYIKLFSFAGNGLSLWQWLALNGRKSCADVKYSNGSGPSRLLTVL